MAKGSIINTHDQLVAARALGLPTIAIVQGDYCFYLYDPFTNADSGAHWTDRGCRTFGYSGWHDKPAALAGAKAWAAEHYGVTEWHGNGMRALVPAEVWRRITRTPHETGGE